MDKFTVEEINLICVYESQDRVRLMVDMKNSMPHVIEPDVTELMLTVIDKLEHMTDVEYADMSFYPADELDEQVS